MKFCMVIVVDRVGSGRSIVEGMEEENQNGTNFNTLYLYALTLNWYADANPCGAARISRPR